MKRLISETAGVTYTELQIANDAITVLTNESNESVACLTFEDLYGAVSAVLPDALADRALAR